MSQYPFRRLLSMLSTGWSRWMVCLSFGCSIAPCSSSSCSKMGYRFCPWTRVESVAAGWSGVALPLSGMALPQTEVAVGVCWCSALGASVEIGATTTWGISTSVTSSSCGLISPIANYLIASHGGSSFPTILESTCSTWEPLDSSNVMSTAISTLLEVLLKTW